MKQKTKKIAIACCITALGGCGVLYGCSGKTPTVTFHENVREFVVGTNIDLTSLLQKESGVDYDFTVNLKDDPKITEIEGETYYAEKSGLYDVTVVASRKGKESEAATKQIAIVDVPPVVFSSEKMLSVNYMTSATLEELATIYPVGISVVSPSQVKYSVSYINFYKNDYVTTPTKYEFNKGAPVGDGFYDGADRVCFNREGLYEVVLNIGNAGGSGTASYVISIRENVSQYEDVSAACNISYNEATYTLSWSAYSNPEYSGTVKYRVKIDYENIITDQTSIDISDYLVAEANGFHNFDLVVIPVDGEGNNITSTVVESDGFEWDRAYKMVVPDVIIAPEGFGYMVTSRGVTIDKDSKTATLTGGAIESLGFMGYQNYSNEYVAWKRDENGNPFKVGTYVDFEFTGNNMPYICLFADEVNGDMSCGTATAYDDESKMNKGIVMINGVYGNYSGTSKRVAASDKLTIFGPNRIQSGWSNPNDTYCPNHNEIYPGIEYEKDASGNYVLDANGKRVVKYEPDPRRTVANPLVLKNYPLLTQKDLSENNFNTRYKLTIGTYTEKGTFYEYDYSISGRLTKEQIAAAKVETDEIILDIRLFDMSQGGKQIYNAHVASGVRADAFPNGGAIIAYCPLKDGEADAQFTVGAPYQSLPTFFEGVEFGANNEVTVRGTVPNSVGCAGHVSKNPTELSGYLAYTDTGINDYVDLTFTGNNMPYITFLADNAKNGLADGKGYTVINGIISKNGLAIEAEGGTGTEFYNDKLRVFGPNRYGASGNDHNFPIFDSKTASSPLSILGQTNLVADHTYRMVAGITTHLGKVYMEILVIDETISERYYGVVELGTESAVATAFGKTNLSEVRGFLMFHGNMKGQNADGNAYATTFKHAGGAVTRASLMSVLPSEPAVLLMAYRNASIDSYGAITIAGVYPANGNPGNLCGIGQDSNYIGWEGDYGVGNYLDFTFTGKNMPNVMFFSNDVSANITDRVHNGTSWVVGNETDGYNYGYLLLNGMKTNGSTTSVPLAHNCEYFSVWGANRLYQNTHEIGGCSIAHSCSTKTTKYNADLVPFQLSSLNDTHEYRYVVGVKEEGGKVVFDMTLVDLTASQTYTATVSTGKTKAELATAIGQTGSNPTGNIVAYAAFKGANNNTTFKVSEVLNAKPTV